MASGVYSQFMLFGGILLLLCEIIFSFVGVSVRLGSVFFLGVDMSRRASRALDMPPDVIKAFNTVQRYKNRAVIEGPTVVNGMRYTNTGLVHPKEYAHAPTGLPGSGFFGRVTGRFRTKRPNWPDIRDISPPHGITPHSRGKHIWLGPHIPGMTFYNNDLKGAASPTTVQRRLNAAFAAWKRTHPFGAHMNNNETPVKPVESLGIPNRRGSSSLSPASSGTTFTSRSSSPNLLVRGMSMGPDGWKYNNTRVVNRRRTVPPVPLRRPSRLRA